MHAHALRRQVAHRVIERGHVDADDLAEVGEAFVEIDHVAQHREVGAIELQHEAGVDDRRVFAPHHVGEREHVSFLARVVFVFQVARDLPGRGRGHEELFRQIIRLGATGRGLRGVDVGLRRRPVLPVDRAGAGRAVLERRGELLEQLRKLGKFLVAGAHGRRALALVAGQPVEHVHGVVGAALLAVIDDVETAFNLLAHHRGHGFAHGRLQLGAARARLLPFGQQQLHHLGGARQAAGVGG